MFDKFKPRMSEAEEVSYAHINLLPRLHLLYNAQKSYRVAKRYKAPPVPERSLLPDLAYKDPNYQRSERRPNIPRERLAFMEDVESPDFEENVDLAYLSLEKKSNGRTDSRTRPGSNPERRPRDPKTPTPRPEIPPENHTPRVFRCWNCDEPGHGFTSCTAPRNKFCFACGQRDVTKAECPRWSGN